MDSNNINFKDLYKQQSTSAPHIEEINKKASKFKKSQLRNSILLILGLAILTAFTIFIWIYFQPEYISTKMGIILIILGMVIFNVQNSKLLSNYKKINTMANNKEYLNNLMEIKRKQTFLQTKAISLYYIILFVGIMLYGYEYASMMPSPYGILFYVLTVAWVAFAWFYIRPKKIKSDKKKLNTLIDNYNSINEQFQEK